MPFKINISEKGKAWKFETESDSLAGKSIGDTVDGKLIKPELEGYQLKITGGSDASGFPLSKDAEGLGLKKVLLTRGWGMNEKGKGLRKRKTVRGKIISNTTAQININVLKSSKKSLAEVFPDQNKAKEIATEVPKEEAKKE
ncbi:MAG: S6e family ribosomal protein [Nanoarchaeota archaeon]|nr:S6e family ribosomal protein [Nanoarchaeota archaeon]